MPNKGFSYRQQAGEEHYLQHSNHTNMDHNNGQPGANDQEREVLFGRGLLGPTTTLNVVDTDVTSTWPPNLFKESVDADETPVDPLTRLTQKTAITNTFNLSFDEFLKLNPNSSTRLQNGIRAVTIDNCCPFNTVADYINAGHFRKYHLFKIPRLGQKTIDEFDNLVIEAIKNGVPSPGFTLNQTLPVISDEKNLSPAFNISLEAFLNQQPSASVRLCNAVREATKINRCPYATVADYINGGYSRQHRLFEILSIGRRTAEEFEQLVKKAIGRDAIAPTILVELHPSGFPKIVPLVKEAFGFLDKREHDALWARLQLRRTLEQIAEASGVTRERIRQIEHKALGKINARFGVAFESTIEQICSKLDQQGRTTYTFTHLEALLECDTATFTLYFKLLEKLNRHSSNLIISEAKQLVIIGAQHGQANWDDDIDHAIVEAKCTFNFQAICNFLEHIPTEYITQRLISRFNATISDGVFHKIPDLQSTAMCLHALRLAGKPLHISEIERNIQMLFNTAVSPSYVSNIVGSHPAITITAPGTYARYADIPYPPSLIKSICDAVEIELSRRGDFLSTRVLYESLFSDNAHQYPDCFNPYHILGFAQDDPRFTAKRGNMIGLAAFSGNIEFVSLEDQIRHFVINEGPIDITQIQVKLSATRQLCNDAGIRNVLNTSRDILCVKKRTYDSVARYFSKSGEYEELILALKLSLLNGAKGLYALSTEMQRLNRTKANVEVIHSMLSNAEDVSVTDEIYSLTKVSTLLARYRTLSTSSLITNGRGLLIDQLSKLYDEVIAEKLVCNDARFSQDKKVDAPAVTVTGTVLKSILSDFKW